MEYVAQEQLRLLDGAITEFTLKHQDLKKQLHIYDLQVQDLEHIIEAVDFNASEGYKLAKKLQQIKRARREVKDNLEVFKCVTTTINFGSLSGVQPKIDKTVKGFEKRGYLVKGLSKSCNPEIIGLLDRSEWKSKSIRR